MNKHLIQTLHPTMLYKSVKLVFVDLEPVTLLLLYVYHDFTISHHIFSAVASVKQNVLVL